MSLKKLFLTVAEKLSAGLVIGLGIAIAITTVVAFQSLTTTPSDSGFQSAGSPLFTRTGGTYDRETNSLEVLGKSVGVTMLSAESASTYTHANAVNYCRDLSAACSVMVDESTCVSGTFTDWRLPSFDALALFVLNPADSTPLWTTTNYGSNILYLELNASTPSAQVPSASFNARCVR